MFSIGLFSTYLPYVLLAMIYGAYVGIHTIMQSEKGDTDDPFLSAKQISKDDAGETGPSDENTFYFDDYTADPGSAAVKPVFRTVRQTFTHYRGPTGRTWYHTALFGRPPPACA